MEEQVDQRHLPEKKKFEPMYTLAVAAELTLFPSTNSLSKFLCLHWREFPPLYRKAGMVTRRVLKLSELEKIRMMTLQEGLWQHRIKRAMQKSNKGPISAIIQRAMRY